MHWSHPSRLQSQNSHQWRTPKICAQREKCWKLRGRRDRDLTNVPLGTIDLGSFEELSDHGDEVEDDESTNETTEMMPPPPLHSWFKRTETFCRKFRKPCNEDHRDEEDPRTVRRFAPKIEPDVKGCFSLNFPVCSVCQKLGVYQRLPIIA